MKKKFLGVVLGLGLALGATVLPAGAASANAGFTCTAGRTATFTSAKPFTVRVITSTTNRLYTARLIGSQYKVHSGVSTVAQWSVPTGAGPVTASCSY